MTLSSISTNVPTTAISFNRKYNELTTSHLQIEALTPHGTTTMDKPGHVPFVIMYNQALRFFSSIIGKNFHILISSPVVITSLKLYPLQLIDTLVTSVIFSSELNFEISPITTNPGAHTYVEKTVLLTKTSYKFHSTDETRPTTHHNNGNSGNVIYMVQCKSFLQQYIGETKRRLKDRFKEHRRPVDNPSNISKPTTVSEHFLANDHSANDITRIPLELIKFNRDSV